MQNIKNVIFVVAIVANIQSSIVGMDSSSKQNAYPAWTITEREAALMSIKKNQRIDHENHIALLSNCIRTSAASVTRVSNAMLSISAAVKEYDRQQAMACLTPEQKQQKRAMIITGLAQKNISSLKASTIIECEVYKKLKKETGMSDQEFRNMTKEILKTVPDLLIRDDL